VGDHRRHPNARSRRFRRQVNLSLHTNAMIASQSWTPVYRMDRL
jgi:hypothetical protein